MPYKSEKIPLGKYDRRVKLSNTQREEIKELRKLGLSYKVIADRYEVSKNLIILVCNPDIAERKRLAFIERSREGRYKPDKEEWAATMREHRKYKEKLHKEGEDMKGIFGSKRLEQAMFRSMMATNILPTPKYAFEQGWKAACKFLERVHEAEEICCQCGKLLYAGDNYFLYDEIGCFCEKCMNKIEKESKKNE